MATTADKVRLSLDVYESSSLIASGWTRIAQSSDSTTGFFGAAYRKGGEIVIAFRGWNDASPNDAASVLATYQNKPFPQMDEAQKFVNAVRAANPGAPVTLTGHSLGGALAATMAVRNGLTAETFGQIESVDAAFKSMNGYAEKFLGITLWDIGAAPQNRSITRAGIDNFAGVTNHVVYGDIAAYNNRAGAADFIGVNNVIGASFATGILDDDSRFGRWLGLTGDVWDDLVPVSVVGAPYSVDFAAQIHSLGFTALPLLFGAEFAGLTAALPRLVLQLTNDWLARDSLGLIPYRLPFDAIDYMVLDHLNAAPGAATVLTGLFGDLHDIANAGPASSARQDADINTALLQLAIQHMAREIIDGDAVPKTGGAITDQGTYLSVSLRKDLNFAPEGVRLARDYAAYLMADTVGRGGSNVDIAARMAVEANNGLSALINGTSESDLIFGGPGNDILIAGASNDAVLGLAGADSLYGGDGNDAVSGGAGADLMLGGNGNDRLGGGADDDRAYGGDGADTMLGGIGNDRIDGGLGADFILGQSGNDVLTGGDGNDLVDGGVGNDTMLGNAGANTFDFNIGAGLDFIIDFTNNLDTLRIDPVFGFGNAAAVLAATSASGSHAVIVLSPGHGVTLAGYLGLNSIGSLIDDIVIG